MRTQNIMQRSLIALTAGLTLVALALIFSAFTGDAPINAQETTKQQLHGLSQAFRDVAKQVGPAVVYISTEQTVKGMQGMQDPHQFRDFFGDEFFRRFFGENMPEREYKRRGLGSGFITTPDGYILTNSHVVAEADEVKVTLADEREFEATVVGTDPKTDIAVIKIEGENFPTANLGDSSTLEVGDWAIAIGTPYGLSQTVTAGIISAEGRSGIGINDYEDFIQTDAAINPGNSGGPLVNIDGEVIGINTAIFSRSGGYQGIGFAIPINMAKSIQESLMTKGKVVRGWLGVLIQPVTPEIAKGFGLEEATGTLVGDVLQGGPAERAGLQRGDIITSFDGQAIDGPNTLKNVVASTPVGKTVPVVVIRDGEEQTIQVEIGEQPTDMQAGITPPSGETETAKLGITVQELTPDIADQLGYANEEGVVISDIEAGSPAAEAGLRRGDLIKEINRNPVTSLTEYNDVMASVNEEEDMLLLIRRGENTRYVVIEAQ
ncbi:Do family serine endopeptidase [candidate division KSB3 bacterium]|uniref:Probable periplasmic serine endoprotease DegP-like n=1 Tax=candidate division KSB3 bacterium TaxID=2044937 RepID=A0A9D5K099_9BACT|nr:Do family serine endopeptidase [candidate division KSB3 bacterium]MBD3327275.1 Do family serine endopeptidase [candidate division KSB3 bacterium]